MSSINNMTTGSPAKHILRFAVPLLLGNLFQQFYNMVDTVIIGQYLGISALASVGATGSICFMIIGLCLGICAGFGIPIAQRFGAKDYPEMRRYIVNAFFTSAVLAIVITTTVLIYCDNILQAMNTPADIYDGSYTYVSILFMGIPLTILYNLCASVVRAMGDSKTPLYFLIISSLLNIILDLILVKPFGIAGPAWATVISQGVSAVLCLIYMWKKYPIIRPESSEKSISLPHVGRLLMQGLPMGLQYSITAIGSVILQTAVNGLGSAYVAAMSAGAKLSMFFCCPYEALGNTAATYGGQNIGAGRPDRIGKGVRILLLYGLIYSIVAAAVLWLFGGPLSRLFMDHPDAFIEENAHLFLKFNSAFYFFLAFVNIVRFMIQGMGYSVLAIAAGFFEMIARSLVGFVFVDVYGYPAACMANPSAWLAADSFLLIAFLLILRREKKRVALSGNV
ncbi:MAG: MATE family efflux transporter [Eubacterium sp.]|nr:MATE family efflux transporter [Eubacterium sp.]